MSDQDYQTRSHSQIGRIRVAVGRRQFSRIAGSFQFGIVERVAAHPRFGMDGGEVAVDRGERPRAGAKAASCG